MFAKVLPKVVSNGTKAIRGYTTNNGSKVLSENKFFWTSEELKEIAHMQEKVAASGELNGTDISVYDLSPKALKAWCDKIDIENRSRYNAAMYFATKKW